MLLIAGAYMINIGQIVSILAVILCGDTTRIEIGLAVMFGAGELERTTVRASGGLMHRGNVMGNMIGGTLMNKRL
jgi:hypothetical protein